MSASFSPPLPSRDAFGGASDAKGGKKRRVPMTKKLEAALQAHRHLIGPRVLYRDDGVSASKQTLTTWMTTAQKRAGSR